MRALCFQVGTFGLKSKQIQRKICSVPHNVMPASLHRKAENKHLLQGETARSVIASLMFIAGLMSSAAVCDSASSMLC